MAPKEAWLKREHQQRNISAGRAAASARIIYTYTIRRTHTHRASERLSLASFFLYVRAESSHESLLLLLGIFHPYPAAKAFRNGGAAAASWISPNLLKNVLQQLSSPRCVCWKNARRQRFCVGCNAKWRRWNLICRRGLGEANTQPRVKNGDPKAPRQPRIYWLDAMAHSSRLTLTDT